MERLKQLHPGSLSRQSATTKLFGAGSEGFSSSTLAPVDCVEGPRKCRLMMRTSFPEASLAGIVDRLLRQAQRRLATRDGDLFAARGNAGVYKHPVEFRPAKIREGFSTSPLSRKTGMSPHFSFSSPFRLRKHTATPVLSRAAFSRGSKANQEVPHVSF